ncbi:MAG: SO_0444 family Cu/Zn efflux transporter [Psychroflexus sp.]|jgi:hypothetical protein|nr:SO_0444 family Cu/Zn efflux transporter [Psychroflexus sp.]MDR9448979.1 SO_0444 family Cu/Zn efflux transporter [Psychroflexus sp.]
MIEQFFIAFWNLTMEMAPYLLLGFLIAGLLNGFFNKEWVQKHVGKPGWKSTLKAAMFGIPLPLCSCGVIPTGVSINQRGASKGATVSFLISTPQTGIDSILITYSLMGWAFAIFRPIIALVTGIFGGLVIDKQQIDQSYSNKQDSCSTDNCGDDCETESDENKSWFQKIFVYAFGTFLKDISRWLILGIVLATFITLFVPDSLFTNYLNEPWLNMLLVLVASIPLYICATSSVPIAAALLMKGISPGAAIVFLMAGPATNMATLTVLWRSLGKRTTLTYLFSIVIGAMGFGLLLDYAFPQTWLSYFTLSNFNETSGHILPHWLMMGSGVILLALIARAEISKFIPQKTKTMDNIKDQKTYSIAGMSCNHCVNNVEKELNSLSAVTGVDVNLEKGQAIVSGAVDDDTVKKHVESIGYEYKGKLA